MRPSIVPVARLRSGERRRPAPRIWRGGGGGDNLVWRRSIAAAPTAGGMFGRSTMAKPARIKHIAFITLDPERMARFYTEVMGLEILHRGDNGSVFLTDGYLNIALLPNKAEGKANGLNHFGFEVDDVEAVAHRIEKFELERPRKRPADRHYAEYRATDPDGNNFDLSTNGYQTVRKERTRAAEPAAV
jgi:catechol 2,3-dioxygenase-like lactoylglutathione lyase family enzyme